MIITNVRTPSSQVSTNRVSVSTRDPDGHVIDTTSSMLTEAIVMGALKSASFNTSTDTPGFLDNATVTFRTAGQVQAGGKVVMQMPDLGAGSQVQSGWGFEVPTVTFATPSTGAPSATAEFNASTRTLTITTSGADMPQGSTYVMIITNVRTPSSQVSAKHVITTTRDTQDKDIDETFLMVTDEIMPGQLTGALNFDTNADTPGALTFATVEFVTSGRVLASGHIILEMPLLGGLAWGFELPRNPIVFERPSFVTGTAKYNESSRALTVTTATN